MIEQFSLKIVFQRLVRPHQYWEKRAADLRLRKGWFVGRTDMYSYVAGSGKYVHYVYSPDGSQRVPFLGRTALRRAVQYAERINRKANERSQP